jgi:hypothetical protein
LEVPPVAGSKSPSKDVSVEVPSINQVGVHNQSLQSSLIKAQNLEYDPEASNPDPEPSEVDELDSNGDAVEVDSHTKDGTINISSSILYPATDKSGKSTKKSISKN